VPPGRSAAGHLVDADADSEDERVVLVRGDLDAVGIADSEPALGDLRDLVAASLDLVLVVALDLDRYPDGGSADLGEGSGDCCTCLRLPALDL
jgi:hypothetical protein